MHTVTVDIYEGMADTPVMSHVAYGTTVAEAEQIICVHAQYDAFLRAALEGRDFKGIPLHITIRRA